MNLKYYLRGLGLGIAITAIIMGIAVPPKKEILTDEEIAAKAETLGMISEEELEKHLETARAETEERVWKEATAQYGETVGKEAGPQSESGLQTGQNCEADKDIKAEETDRSVQNAEEEDGMEEEDGTAQESERRQGTEQETAEEGMMETEKDLEDEEAEADERAETEEMLVFTVKKGETPFSIGKRLEENGMLPENAEFDKFLVDNGYDTKVVASEYRIPKDADMDTIARIITKQN